MAFAFPTSWLAAGIVTAESTTAFTRYAAAEPARPLRHWLWLALRDYLEENTPLDAEMCRRIYQIGESETDPNLGTAMMCTAVYERNCPADVKEAAAASDRAAVRRAVTFSPSPASR